jgi:hypothetical protein
VKAIRAPITELKKSKAEPHLDLVFGRKKDHHSATKVSKEGLSIEDDTDSKVFPRHIRSSPETIESLCQALIDVDINQVSTLNTRLQLSSIITQFLDHGDAGIKELDTIFSSKEEQELFS